MKRLDATSRKEQIVKVAIRLFSKDGFKGTTTKDIARQAKVSEALLFKHFPHKKDLYGAILQFKMEEKIPPLLSELPAEGSPERILKDLALKICSLHEEDPSFMRLLYFSVLEGHGLSDLFFQKRQLPIRDYLKNYLAREMARGTLKKGDAEKEAYAFLAMVWGYVNTRVLFRMPQVVSQPASHFLGPYVDIFLKGISK